MALKFPESQLLCRLIFATSKNTLDVSSLHVRLELFQVKIIAFIALLYMHIN